MDRFTHQYNGFTDLMGTAPRFMNGFVDPAKPIGEWPSNASWTAWSWRQSPLLPNQWRPTGDGDGNSLSVRSVIDFAKAHGKPLAIVETGVGSSASGPKGRAMTRRPQNGWRPRRPTPA